MNLERVMKGGREAKVKIVKRWDRHLEFLRMVTEADDGEALQIIQVKQNITAERKM